MEAIVAEAESLAKEGVKELILIAQDTTYYGLDLYRRRALAELIRRLSAVSGIEWIRIHYSYPVSYTHLHAPGFQGLTGEVASRL